ncbi:MAG: hypothetical protein ACOYOJ_11060 [Alsobacter sp.]
MSAAAQGNLDKLKQFKVATTDLNIPVVPQTGRNADGVADEVKSLAPSLEFNNPNGVCWTRDGFLIVVEHNRVLNFSAAEFFDEGPEVAVIEVVPQGKLILPEEESFTHGARVCDVGSAGMRCVSLGQPFNVQPRNKVKLYDEIGIGGSIRLNPPSTAVSARCSRSACATRWARTSTRRTAVCGGPKPRSTARVTTSRRAS